MLHDDGKNSECAIVIATTVLRFTLHKRKRNEMFSYTDLACPRVSLVPIRSINIAAAAPAPLRPRQPLW